MADRKEIAQEIQGWIQRFLLQEWDPVGVQAIPEAKDEYDDYVGRVCRLLATGVSPQEVAEHLAEIDVTTMGLPERAIEPVLPAAEKLCLLSVRLERKWPWVDAETRWLPCLGGLAALLNMVVMLKNEQVD